VTFRTRTHTDSTDAETQTQIFMVCANGVTKFSRTVSATNSCLQRERRPTRRLQVCGTMADVGQTFLRKKLRKDELSQQDDGEEFLNLDYTPCINRS